MMRSVLALLLATVLGGCTLPLEFLLSELAAPGARNQYLNALSAAVQSGALSPDEAMELWSAPDTGTLDGAGTPVYSAGECIGPVVAGVCHGSVIDTNPARPRCYGTMLNGQCTGPMF